MRFDPDKFQNGASEDKVTSMLGKSERSILQVAVDLVDAQAILTEIRRRGPEEFS